MAPSEAAILHQFLLSPAQLPAILSLEDFAALFPKPLQNSAQVRALYRDLQHQRNAVVDAVAADIDAEVARGRLLRRHAVRARLRADAQEDTAGDDELVIEQYLAAAASPADTAGGSIGGRKHTLVSMVAELDAAAQDLEADLQLLGEEEVRLRQSVQHTIGSLSDLRYGRLANNQLRDQVLEGLQTVQEACETAAAGSRSRTPHAST